ncbi:RfbX Membrane protein involved in the export of O-antigen and teichoic acid [Candidatus Methylopumilus universalis]|uniref:lipopolysaccharide biosynthesis protein n=1 Tax=Candidatus Methylopumilus universalis TaxID=2588536 RepID=UPI003BEEC6EF
MHSLKKGVVAGIFSSVWLAVLSLFLSPKYLSYLGLECYALIGLYTTGLAIGGILDFAFSSNVTRELAGMNVSRRNQLAAQNFFYGIEFLYWFCIIVLGLFLFALILVFGSSWLVSATISENKASSILILIILSLVIQVPVGLYSSVLIGFRKQFDSAVTLAFFGTFRGVIVLLSISMFKASISDFFILYIAINLLQMLWMRKVAWSLLRVSNTKLTFPKTLIARIKHSVNSMFFISCAGVAISQFDKIILAFIVPLESLGYYVLAWSFSSSLTILSSPIAQGFGARFSALEALGKASEFKKFVVLVFQFTSAIVIPPTLLIAFFSQLIMTGWISDLAIAKISSPILCLLSIGTGSIACVYPLLFAIYAKQDFKMVLKIQIIAFGLSFPFFIFMAIKLGVLGAAISWAIYGIALLCVYIAKISTRCGGHIFLKMISSFISISLVCALIDLIAKIALLKMSSSVNLTGYSIYFLLSLVLMVSWTASFLMIKNLRDYAFNQIKQIKSLRFL